MPTKPKLPESAYQPSLRVQKYSLHDELNDLANYMTHKLESKDDKAEVRDKIKRMQKIVEAF